MLTITTIDDILRLREGEILPALLLNEIESHFKQLAEGFTGEPDAWVTYDLSTYGGILVLQPGIDDPRDLGTFGLTRESGGLFGMLIEYTMLIELGELQVFRSVILLDNDFGLVIYSPVGGFGDEFDGYLVRFMEDG